MILFPTVGSTSLLVSRVAIAVIFSYFDGQKKIRLLLALKNNNTEAGTNSSLQLQSVTIGHNSACSVYYKYCLMM